jgi:hypothetical protein
LLAGLHEFWVGGVGEGLYHLVVLGAERVALVIVESEAVRDTPRSPMLQRGEGGPIVDPMHPIQW